MKDKCTAGRDSTMVSHEGREQMMKRVPREAFRGNELKSLA